MEFIRSRPRAPSCRAGVRAHRYKRTRGDGAHAGAARNRDEPDPPRRAARARGRPAAGSAGAARRHPADPVHGRHGRGRRHDHCFLCDGVVPERPGGPVPGRGRPGQGRRTPSLHRHPVA